MAVKKFWPWFVDKEDFIYLIEQLEKFIEFEDKMYELFGCGVVEGDMVAAIDGISTFLMRTIYDEKTIDDPHFIDDISYYLYELDCGKKWKPGTITLDGKDMPLRNAEDLWELLTYDYKEG